jgi:hypothetical protein
MLLDKLGGIFENKIGGGLLAWFENKLVEFENKPALFWF